MQAERALFIFLQGKLKRCFLLAQRVQLGESFLLGAQLLFQRFQPGFQVFLTLRADAQLRGVSSLVIRALAEQGVQFRLTCRKRVRQIALFPLCLIGKESAFVLERAVRFGGCGAPQDANQLFSEGFERVQVRVGPGALGVGVEAEQRELRGFFARSNGEKQQRPGRVEAAGAHKRLFFAAQFIPGIGGQRDQIFKMPAKFWNLFERNLKNRQVCLADQVVGAADVKGRYKRVFLQDSDQVAHQVEGQAVGEGAANFIQAGEQTDIQQSGRHLRRTCRGAGGILPAAGLPGGADEQRVIQQLAQHDTAGQLTFGRVEDVNQVTERGYEEDQHAFQSGRAFAAQRQQQGNQ